jgi:uncharacterized iron-regulated membrane protein
MLVLAVTGLIYLFRFQIEPLVHADLMRVDHQPGQLIQPYETQRLAVAEAQPDATLVSITEPSRPDESTRFTLETSAGETRDVFVDPYRAEVLGSLNPDTTISGTAVRIHGDLMAGKAGEVVMEFGACWAIVMALTGYYLFLKGRRARQRQRAKRTPSALLRSNHARVGSVVGVGLLLLVVSGLPWTGIWGAQTQKLATANGTSFWSEDPGALSHPSSTLDESLPHSHHVIPWAQEKSSVPESAEPGDEVSVANVDTAVAVADKAGLAHPLTVALPADGEGVFSAIGYAFNDPAKERTVHVDQYGGGVVATYGYADYPLLAKVVSQGIGLHEGRSLGLVSFWATALFCVAVMFMCVTGPMMWWRRRPRRQPGVPRSMGAPRGRLPIKATPLLAFGLVALGVFLPLFGLSLIVVLLLDQLLLRRVPRLRAWFYAV